MKIEKRETFNYLTDRWGNDIGHAPENTEMYADLMQYFPQHEVGFIAENLYSEIGILIEVEWQHDQVSDDAPERSDDLDSLQPLKQVRLDAEDLLLSIRDRYGRYGNVECSLSQGDHTIWGRLLLRVWIPYNSPSLVNVNAISLALLQVKE